MVVQSRRQIVRLRKNQVLALKGRQLLFECLTGAIWITGLPRKEFTVTGGGQCEFDSTHIICIQAFEFSVIRVTGAFKFRRSVAERIDQRWLAFGETMEIE